MRQTILLDTFFYYFANKTDYIIENAPKGSFFS